MSFDHDVLVWFSKSYGLFYLIAMSLAVVVYAFWPSNQKKFNDAAEAILHEEDRPNRIDRKLHGGQSWQ